MYFSFLIYQKVNQGFSLPINLGKLSSDRRFPGLLPPAQGPNFLAKDLAEILCTCCASSGLASVFSGLQNSGEKMPKNFYIESVLGTFIVVFINKNHSSSAKFFSH